MLIILYNKLKRDKVINTRLNIMQRHHLVDTNTVGSNILRETILHTEVRNESDEQNELHRTKQQRSSNEIRLHIYSDHFFAAYSQCRI